MRSHDRSRTVPRRVAAGLVLLGLVVAACGTEQATPSLGGGGGAGSEAPASASASGGSSGGGGESVESTIENVQFGADLNVPVGTTVIWTNADGVAHTVTHGAAGQPADNPFFDQSIQPGETFEFGFQTVGTVPVTCRIHPDMEMQVITQ